MKVKKLFAIGLISLTPMVTMAAESGWYVGFNLGQSSIDANKDDLDAIAFDAFRASGFSVLSASSSLDDSDTTWSLNFGYQFSPYFALEGSYVDLGKLKYSASGTVRRSPAAAVPATLGFDWSAKGPALAAVGMMPIGKAFELQGRIGALFAKTDFDIAASIQGSSAADHSSDTSNNFLIGIGAAYNFTNHVALSLNWTRYGKVGNEDETGEADVDVASLGMKFTF